MASKVKVDTIEQQGSSGIVLSHDVKLASGTAIKNAAGTALLTQAGVLDNVSLGSSVIGAGGELVKISSTSVSGTTVYVTDGDTDYDTFFVVYKHIKIDIATQNDGHLKMKTYTGTDSGTGGTDGHTWGWEAEGGNTADNTLQTRLNSGSGEAWLPITGNNLTDSNPVSNEITTGFFWIYGAQGTHSAVFGQNTQIADSTNALRMWRYSGRKETAGAINKFGFYWNQSGDITGTITLYGMVD